MGTVWSPISLPSDSAPSPPPPPAGVGMGVSRARSLHQREGGFPELICLLKSEPPRLPPSAPPPFCARAVCPGPSEGGSGAGQRVSPQSPAGGALMGLSGVGLPFQLHPQPALRRWELFPALDWPLAPLSQPRA